MQKGSLVVVGVPKYRETAEKQKKHPTGIEPVTSGSAIPHSTTELWMPEMVFMISSIDKSIYDLKQNCLDRWLLRYAGFGG